MKMMSTPYETGGRSAQKARTRDALVAAARHLVAAGVTPTVEDAAGAASISRTTAYRYFPTKRALLLAAHPEIAATSMLPADPPQDPAARLDAVVANFSAMILDTEAQQRTMLRLSLEADPAERDALPLRQGRAIAWIAEALDGVRSDLSDQQFRQLVLSVRATIGIEAIVWLVDVAHLSRNDAVALTRWSAQALLQRATTVAPPTPSRPGKQGRRSAATVDAASTTGSRHRPKR
jgi:AcrR family transcriptional regulator